MDVRQKNAADEQTDTDALTEGAYTARRLVIYYLVVTDEN